jgi:chromosomal replication initiation ATPase DnaA
LMLDGDQLEIEFDFANLMRGDAASRSAYYQSGIQNGWLTRNEARISENLNPLQGLDQPLRPLNMVEEEDAEEAEQENDQNSDTNESEPDDATSSVDQEMSLRFRMLVAANANRLARRIAKKGSIGTNEIGLISQTFGLGATHVNAWAQQQALPLQEDALSASLNQLGMNP